MYCYIAFIICYASCFYYAFLRASKQPKLIVVTGAIAVGKTTFAKELRNHLASDGKCVLLRKEVSRKLESELKIFHGNITNRAFWFQDKLTQAYSDEMEEIKECGHLYDYIIMDRSHLDMSIFNQSIEEPDLSWYLGEKMKKIKFPFDITRIIYLKPSIDTMLTRFYTRKSYSDGVDNLSEGYLVNIYSRYNEIRDVYRKYENFETFENDCGIEDYYSYIRDLDI